MMPKFENYPEVLATFKVRSLTAKGVEETVEEGLNGNDTTAVDKSKMTLRGNSSPENVSVGQDF